MSFVVGLSGDLVLAAFVYLLSYPGRHAPAAAPDGSGPAGPPDPQRG